MLELNQKLLCRTSLLVARLNLSAKKVLINFKHSVDSFIRAIKQQSRSSEFEFFYNKNL